MQYVWAHRLWPAGKMATNDGRHIAIIDPGRLNSDSGPDFFNAKIKIDGETWVGNVEIHVKASDWHRHGHDGDPAYDNVILHVVDSDDTAIQRPNGSGTIPQMVMKCTPDLNRHYANLVATAAADIACRSTIATMEGIYLRDWLDALSRERLNEKAARIESYVRRLNGDWEQAAFTAIARALGSGVNGDIFERLALNVPLRLVARHNDSLIMSEAFIFGQSGLLDGAPRSDYTLTLEREYKFLKAKFNLSKPQGMLWKMARMRPASFPHRRVALLALLLHKSTRFLSRVVEALDQSPADDSLFKKIFDCPLTGHWANHYTFAETATDRLAPSIGATALTSLMINAVVPIAYAYGVHLGDFQLADRALEKLHTLAPESNTIVRAFRDTGVPCDDAADSQAIIQLRRAYCEQRKCLYCRIGHRALSAAAVRTD